MLVSLRILGTARSGTTLLWKVLLQNANTMGLYQPSTTPPGVTSENHAKSPVSFKQDKFFSTAYQLLLKPRKTFSHCTSEIQEFCCDPRNLTDKTWISKDVVRASPKYRYKLFQAAIQSNDIFNIFMFRHPFNYIRSWDREHKRGLSRPILDFHVSSYKRLLEIVSFYLERGRRNFCLLEFESFTQYTEYCLEQINQHSNLGLTYSNREYSGVGLAEKTLFGNQLQRELVLGLKVLSPPTYSTVNNLSRVLPIREKSILDYEKPFHLEVTEFLMPTYKKLQEASLIFA